MKQDIWLMAEKTDFYNNADKEKIQWEQFFIAEERSTAVLTSLATLLF